MPCAVNPLQVVLLSGLGCDHLGASVNEKLIMSQLNRHGAGITLAHMPNFSLEWLAACALACGSVQCKKILLQDKDRNTSGVGHNI